MMRGSDYSESENEMTSLVIGGASGSTVAKKRNVEQHGQPAPASPPTTTPSTVRGPPIAALSSLTGGRDWSALLEDGWKHLPEWFASQPEFLVGVFNVVLITVACYYVGATEVRNARFASLSRRSVITCDKCMHS